MFPAPNWYLQRTCSWSDDGQRLALASRDAVVLLQRGACGNVRAYANLRGHKDKITAVRFFRGMCVSASEDGDIRIWDTDIRRCVKRVPERTTGLRCMGTSKTSSNVVACGHVDCVTLWNISKDEIRRVPLDKESSRVICMSNIVRDNIAAIGLENGVVCLVSVEKAAIMSRIFESCNEMKTPVHHLEWDDTHEVIGASFADASLRLWNPNDGKLLHRFVLEKSIKSSTKRRKPWYTFAWVNPQAYFDEKRTGRLISGKSIVASSSDGSLYMHSFRWKSKFVCADISKCSMKIVEGICGGHTGSVFSIVPCPNENYVHSISMDRTMCVWNIAENQCLARYGMLGGFAYDAQFLDAQNLALACGDGMIRVLTSENQHRSLNLKRHVWKGLLRKRVLTLCLHPMDSSKIACGTNDGHVYVYNNVDDRESLDSDSFVRIRLRKDNVSIENVQWQMWNVSTSTNEKKDDAATLPLLYARDSEGVVSEIDPMFPLVEAVRMDVRFEAKCGVKQLEWKTPSSHTLPPTVALAICEKECVIVKILSSGVKCASRGSTMKKILSWSFPFEQVDEKKRSVILRWCPNSDTIAVSIDRVIWILSISTTNISTTTLNDQHDLKLCGHEASVSDISWFPRREKKDHLLLTTSLDRTAQIWHVESKTPLRNLRGHTGSIYFGVWLNESSVLTGSSDHSVRIWNINDSPYEVPPRTKKKA